MATISSQVIGWVRERFSLPWRALRSRQRLPERGFRKAEDSGAAVFSSSYGDRVPSGHGGFIDEYRGHGSKRVPWPHPGVIGFTSNTEITCVDM
jgi:hypothetical protein